MKSIKAPANLSRRDVKQFILDQREDAIEFGAKIKEEVVAFLKFGENEELHPYIDAAAARITINYGLSNEISFRHSQRDDKPQWLHVWSFKGTARSFWSDTNMVIRVNGTLNVEHLSERILRMATDDLRGVESAIKKAAVAEAIGEYVAPKGYRVSPEAHGVTVSYLDAYGGSLSLSRTVDASKVAELIIAHQRLVEAYKAIS
jgi:hypothetical protein